ncbi:MAG: HxsD-like protein [Nanoarchaeota archaeon]|nr:HxsD-like protein [Nanoarchaeota archaeon]MCA9495901.1 HxsD-like protein [Nanoarchaeota archaeon]
MFIVKKIVIQNGFAFVYFLSSFYTKESILNSVTVYSQFFKAEVSQVGKYFVVKVLKINDLDNSYSLEVLVNEFSNYVLSCEYDESLLDIANKNDGLGEENGF